MKCPKCGADEEPTSGARIHYTCGSYGYSAKGLAHRSDLCDSREEVAELRRTIEEMKQREVTP